MVEQNIKLIVFDAGQTLLFPTKSPREWYKEVLLQEKLLVEDKLLQCGYIKAQEYFSMIIDSHSNQGGFHSLSQEERNRVYTKAIEIIINELGYAGDSLELAEKINQKYEVDLNFTLFPDAKKVIPLLAEKVPLGICSNWDLPKTIESILLKNNFRSYFHFILQSNQVGCGKPNEKIYNEIIELSGFPPKNILFVGDDLRNDYLGPKRAGMNALLIDREGKITDKSIGTIKSLEELKLF